ncbi:hypothetical protein SO802_010624 [Lithocarpus litseifolius]|uniref:Uncharacterized protein n=1 Tax=Lithocarpus litseifolius TaxID=425828 RepID=A0AAW2DGZ4_9ROSI
MSGPPSSMFAFAFFYALLIITSLVNVAHAQNQTKAATDPNEVRALNSIFQEWKISPTLGQWNISGEPCTGAAIDNTSFINMDYNPFIKCECSYKNGTVCHILELKETWYSMETTF